MTSPDQKSPFSLANMMSFSRIVLTPFFVVPFLWGDHLGYLIALSVLAFIEASDILDGHVARTFGQGSRLGQLLDPMADTITRFSIFLCFLKAELIPFWMIFIFFVRDMSVAYFRAFAATEGLVIGARYSGKIKAVVQGFAVGIACMMLVWTRQDVEGLYGAQEALTRSLWVQGISTAAIVALFIVLRVRGLPLFMGFFPLTLMNLCLVAPFFFEDLARFQPALLVSVLLYLAAAVTLYSFVDYSLAFLKAMGAQLRGEQQH
ncbi:MAG: CDP-alcohol phosphatidyltransferase family protein [Myxococcota bacterium]|nr:CDP-alcohol phosphatidyltransferase family protein [Myxococcota bacterium]